MLGAWNYKFNDFLTLQSELRFYKVYRSRNSLTLIKATVNVLIYLDLVCLHLFRLRNVCLISISINRLFEPTYWMYEPLMSIQTMLPKMLCKTPVCLKINIFHYKIFLRLMALQIWRCLVCVGSAFCRQIWVVCSYPTATCCLCCQLTMESLPLSLPFLKSTPAQS